MRDVTIRICWGSLSFGARTRNISERGLYVETSIPLWIGASFTADLMLQPPLLVTCSVTRSEPNQHIGVEVGFLDEETQERCFSLVAEACSTTVRN